MYNHAHSTVKHSRDVGIVAFYFHCQLFTKDTSRKGLIGCQVIKGIYPHVPVMGGNIMYVLKNVKCDATCNMHHFLNFILEKSRLIIVFFSKIQFSKKQSRGKIGFCSDFLVNDFSYIMLCVMTTQSIRHSMGECL